VPRTPNVSIDEPSAEATGVPGKLFIIDDDRSLLSLLKLILEDASFSVRTFLDASRALDEVNDAQPDAIILDLEMPVMNGRVFYRALRDKGLTMPVLILSAYGAREAQAELGADAAVDKPFEPEDLVQRVSALIAHK
jgi:two-component system response regulator PrrA